MSLLFDKVNKIITVQAPDVKITVQSLHNQIREFEDDLVNTNIKEIVSSEGKQPLGDDQYVGITLTLLNGWKLGFEERSGPDTIQCVVTGGNFVGEIHPTPFTQVVVEKSSSATLMNLDTIQYISYGGAVNIDVNSVYSGVEYPVGNREYPVNNVDDAIVINDYLNLNKFRLLSNVNFQGGQNISGIKIMADIGSDISVVVEQNVNTFNTVFENIAVNGIMGGSSRYLNCILGLIDVFEGEAKRCLITDDITIAGQGASNLSECNVYVSDYSAYKIIDLNGNDINMLGCRGNYELTNKTTLSTTSVNLMSGKLKIDSSCVSGTIVVSGNVIVEDDSGVDCNIILEGKCALQQDTDNMIIANS